MAAVDQIRTLRTVALPAVQDHVPHIIHRVRYRRVRCLPSRSVPLSDQMIEAP